MLTLTPPLFAGVVHAAQLRGLEVSRVAEIATPAGEPQAIATKNRLGHARATTAGHNARRI